MSYILLVEDDPENAKMMIRLLESVGLSVYHAERGLDGLAKARRECPSLILMDFNLPDIDGRTLGLTLKKQLGGNASPPIIAVTARTGDFEKHLAKKFGYNAFISKPFDPHEFLDVVKKLLESAD
jgi:CheY-like chemotaxis protein